MQNAGLTNRGSRLRAAPRQCKVALIAQSPILTRNAVQRKTETGIAGKVAWELPRGICRPAGATTAREATPDGRGNQPT